jgi:hypothetical protein
MNKELNKRDYSFSSVNINSMYYPECIKHCQAPTIEVNILYS